LGTSRQKCHAQIISQEETDKSQQTPQDYRIW
jgi:hypothetical protein